MDSFPSRLLINVILVLIIAILRLVQVSVEDVSEARLTKMSEEGHIKAKKALKKLENSSRIYYCFKIIILFCELLVIGLTSVYLFKAIPSAEFLQYEIPIIAVMVLLTTLFIELFGIYIPQKIASRQSEKIMFGFLWLINIIYAVITPFERLLSFISSLLLMPFGVKPADEEEEEITEEEIRFMVDIGSESGAIDPDEKDMIHNIFELDDTPVKDIMTHRTDVVFLWEEESIDAWEEIISTTNHSIYPVCKETVDDILGFVKTTDFYKLLRNLKSAEEPDVSPIIRNPYLVPESIKADDLFRQMQISKNHFAIVVDEYGGLGGIITMSDLLEEIVGDLDNDSEKDEEAEIIRLDSNTWKILGSTEIEKVSKELDIELPLDEYNTFAGMILAELGAIPDDGSTAEVEAFGLQIKVTKISEHRIDEAIVCKIDIENNEDE